MNTVRELTEKQLRCRVVFKGIWVLYFIAVAAGFYWLVQDHIFFVFPLATGVVLGSIYFAVAGYTFYDLFLSRQAQNNRAGLMEVSFGKMMSWLMPVTVMVFFVCMSFILIYDLPVDDSENRGIYFSHPYLLGKIYKEAESLGDNGLQSQAMLDLITKAHGVHFYASDTVKSATENGVADLSLQDRAEALAHMHKIPFHIAFAFSFVGVLLFTLADVVTRFRSKDLYPKTFIAYQTRFILAISLAIVIANFYMDYWPVNSGPLLFLAIGMFPRRAMDFMEKKARSVFNLEKEERDALPLTLLQGMTSYYYERFREINISDIQNLAQSDLRYLRKNLSCGSRMIADFVSQAVLIELFPKGNMIELLRVRGVRDIVSLRDALEARDSRVVDVLDLSRKELLAILNSAALQVRIDVLRAMKQEVDCRDEKHFVNRQGEDSP